MFRKYEKKKRLIKNRLQECSTMLETCGKGTLPYRALGRLTLFAKMKLPLTGVCFRTGQAIIAAVEQSIRRLEQRDAVDGLRRLPDVWRRVLHAGGGYFRSLKQSYFQK